MNDAWHYQIKAAQRDLIKFTGGIERAVEMTEYAKSTVGRWNNPADPELMPLSAVRALERETGRPLITSILAQETGCKLVEPNGPTGDAAALEAMVRKLVVDVMEIGSSSTTAAADKHISSSESAVIRNPVSRARDTLRQIEQFLSGVQAQGGIRLVAGEE